MKIALLCSLFICMLILYWVSMKIIPKSKSQPTMEDMKIKIIVGDHELTATMYDNPTTRDFISMLPIETSLEDYAKMEKIFYPERKLSKAGDTGGYNPMVGDITYYAPWGDIAIFYKDFGYANGLISLGKIDDDGIDIIKNMGERIVIFKLMDN